MNETLKKHVLLLTGLVLGACGAQSQPAEQPAAVAEPSDAAAPGSEQPAPASSADSARRVPAQGPNGEKWCGGFAGDTCAPSEYCAYEARQYCGAADASAVCKPRPEMCNDMMDPVCGCDHKPYSNACQAAVAGTGVLDKGECPPNP
jgi:hypothetical protein